MPRKRRTQPGTSGGAYSNRSDLSQPVRAPSGGAYGERQALEQAQAQAPLPQQQPMDRLLQAAQGYQFSPVQLNAPTARPDEPITFGLPSGPGAGPQALPGLTRGVSARLEQLAAESADPTIREMARRAKGYGL